MSYESFTFNGIKKDWIYNRRGRRKPPFASLSRNIVKVPGMAGAHLGVSQIEPLIIEQPIGFKVINEAHALNLKDELASWLFTTEPVPLVFDDEPNRTYYAIVQNTIDDFERIATLRQGTIQFLCLDPYGYGEERTYPLSQVTRIPNEGTADTYPIFDLTVTEDSTLVYISNNSNLDENGDRRTLYLGMESSTEDELIEPTRLVLHDMMQSTSGWIGATEVDSGFVDGTFATDSEGFYVSDWGSEESSIKSQIEAIDNDVNQRRDSLRWTIDTKNRELKQLQDKKNPTEADKVRIKELKKEISELNSDISDLDTERRNRKKAVLGTTNIWIGPSLQKAISPIKNFMFTVDLSNRNYRDNVGDRVSDSGVGIMEIYFRDVNGHKVCKLQFGDITSNAAINHLVFQTGDIREVYHAKGTPANWNDFDGNIQIMRDHTDYYITITKIKNGQVVGTRELARIITPGGVGLHNVAYVQVAIRKPLGAKRIYQRIKEIKLHESLYDAWGKPTGTVLMEFKAGDRLYIDMNKNLFLLNNEQRLDLVHAGSRFFTLIEGLNEIELSDNVEGTIKFPTRYL